MIRRIGFGSLRSAMLGSIAGWHLLVSVSVGAYDAPDVVVTGPVVPAYGYDRILAESNAMTSKRHDPYQVEEPFRGIYAHGVESPAGARVLHISGQVGVSQDGQVAHDFESQCRQALLNLEGVLKSAGMGFSNITKMSFFLVRRADMGDLVKVRKELLDGVRPAITTVIVAGLVSEDWLIEVDAVAYQ